MSEVTFEPVNPPASEGEIQFEPVNNAGPQKKEGKIGRQIAAGILDIGSTLPAIPGLIQAVGELAYRGTTSDEPFTEDLKKSLDNKLLRLANEGYNWSSEVTGAGEPETAGEQVARLASLLIPISAGTKVASTTGRLASKLGASAEAANKIGRATDTAVNLASPLVKLEKKAGAPVGGYLTKGNTARYLGQAGIAVGLDQGARSLTGAPTIASAMEDPTISAGTDTGVTFEPVIPNAPVAQGKISFEPVGVDPKVELDKQLETEQDKHLLKNIITGAAVLGAAYGTHKWRSYAARAKMAPGVVAPAGMSEVTDASYRTAGETLHSKLIDQQTAITAAMRHRGFVKEAEEISGQANVHTADQFGEVSTSGKFDATDFDSGKPVTIQMPPLNKWLQDGVQLGETKFPELGNIDTREALGKYFAFKYERNNRIRATGHKLLGGDAGVAGKSLDEIERELATQGTTRSDYIKTGLREPTGFLMENDALFSKGIVEAIDSLDANHPIRQYINQSKELADFPLKMLEARGFVTKEFAAQLRKEFSIADDLHYIPSKEAQSTGLHKLGQWLKKIGRGTDNGNEIREFEYLSHQGLGEGGGIQRPMDHQTAMAHYIYSAMDFANRDRAKRNILFKLAEEIVPTPEQIRKGIRPPEKLAFRIGTKDPSKVGHDITWDANLPQHVKDHFRVEGTSGADVFSKLNNDVIWIREKGLNVGYYVPDKMLREAVRLQPRLYHTLNEVGRTFKNLYHATTVRLPMFVPISAAYQVGQTTLNSLAHGVKFNPFTDTWKGMAASFSDKFAVEMMNQIDYGLKANSGFFANHPQFAAQFRARMEKVLRNSVLSHIKREAGGFATSMGSHETYTGARDVMKLASPGWKDNYSTAGSLWRVYTYMMDAMREGSAAGLALRLTKDRAAKEAKELRRVMKDVRNIAGDIRRVGSSAVAETVQSWVPFSGPMLDAWNTIGIAAHRNPGKFATAVGTVIVLPTAIEIAYNSMLGDEFRDWYWNTLTPEQRVNNFIIGIPGLPPEQSILIPITPEWSIARAVVLEAMDMLSGWSQINEAKLTGENGSNFQAAFARTFDLPAPPLVQAGFAAKGNVIQFGPKFTPGDIVPELYTMHPMGMGEQISGARGRSRYVDGVFDSEVDGVLRALAGGVASIYSNMAESFRQGKRTSTSERFHFATEAAGREIVKQAKYLNPLFPSLRPTANDDISDSVRLKKEGLKRIGDEINLLRTHGLIQSMERPIPFGGNALQPSQDPLLEDLWNTVTAVKFQIKQYDTIIADNRAQLSNVNSSSVWHGKRLSREQQAKVADTLTLKIKTARAEQLALLQRAEASASQSLSQKYGREIDIDFSTFKPRPNLPGVSQ